MTSTLPNVQIKDLSVYIDSKDGRIPITLNPSNGTFSLPMRESLVAEGAFIEVNQPKGTMNFQCTFSLSSPKCPPMASAIAS